MRGGADGRLAAVAAATAVQAGHVDAVQVVLVLPTAAAQWVAVTVIVQPAKKWKHCKGPPEGAAAPVINKKKKLQRETREVPRGHFCYVCSQTVANG